MRHRVSGYKLNRSPSHRKAMWRNMAISLLTHGQIETTVTKAKSLRPLVERLINSAKKGDLASRRRVIKAIGDPILVDRDLKDYTRQELREEGYVVNKYHELQDGPRLVKKLFDEIGPRYADREGGYTRIIRITKHRIGDASDLCIMQLVGDEVEGPQVRGEYSRRRDKAHRRMEFAAQLRKGAKAEAPAAEEAPKAEAAPAEEPATEEGNEEKSE